MTEVAYYGIDVKLVTPYLANRRHRVEIVSPYICYKVYSDWDKVQQGVPQGSILDPLCLSYTNDVLPNTECPKI
jgi:hypothetical protein